MADAASKLRKLIPESLHERFGEVVDKIGDGIARVKAGRKYDLIDPKYGPYERAPVYSDDGTMYHPDDSLPVKNKNTGNIVGVAKNKKWRRVENRKGEPYMENMPMEPALSHDDMPAVMEDHRGYAMPRGGIKKTLSQM